jgi:hypothetical protein
MTPFDRKPLRLTEDPAGLPYKLSKRRWIAPMDGNLMDQWMEILWIRDKT